MAQSPKLAIIWYIPLQPIKDRKRRGVQLDENHQVGQEGGSQYPYPVGNQGYRPTRSFPRGFRLQSCPYCERAGPSLSLLDSPARPAAHPAYRVQARLAAPCTPLIHSTFAGCCFDRLVFVLPALVLVLFFQVSNLPRLAHSQIYLAVRVFVVLPAPG